MCVCVCVRPPQFGSNHINMQIPCLVLQEADVYLCESDGAYNEGGWSHDNASVCVITVCHLTTRHRGELQLRTTSRLDHSFWIILFNRNVDESSNL